MEFEEALNAFDRIASSLENNRALAVEALTEIETMQMAQLETNKTVKALRTYGREIPYLLDRIPLGKVGVFLPFNTPLYGLVLYACGPILAGNRVLVKPSSASYEVTRTLYENFFQGELGHVLTVHPPGRWFLQQYCFDEQRVQAISFTGQWRSVQSILQLIPDSIRVIYSGSGYNPFIVLSNANVKRAVDVAVSSRLWNSGQDCLAAERFYIEDEIFDEFVEYLVQRVAEVKAGENRDIEAQVGPLISVGAAEYIEKIIADSEASARILLKGEIDGQLISPFIFQAEAHSPLVLAEKYAPIFALVRVKSRGEIVKLANELDFALGATVWGEDESVIHGLSAAHVAVNSSILEIEDEDAHIPFGGYRNSGFVRHKMKGYRKAGPILYSVETSLPRFEV